MTIQGTVVNGVVVPDSSGLLPEGTRVEIVVPELNDKINEGDAEQSLRKFLLEFSGTCPGLPSDMAAQHDYYIHGTPKR